MGDKSRRRQDQPRPQDLFIFEKRDPGEEVVRNHHKHDRNSTILSMRNCGLTLRAFFFVTHQCMASKTSVSFLVVCGIFLLIFLVALFFLLYYFLRRACLVKAIEIIHTEANQQQNQLSVDRLHVFTESNMTSISAPAVQNDHCKTSSFNVRQTVTKEDIEVTILWQEVLI